MFIGNNEDIIKYIKNIGLNGFIYHPKQLFNIFPSMIIYNFMNNCFIMYKLNIYKSSDFVNKFVYNSNYLTKLQQLQVLLIVLKLKM